MGREELAPVVVSDAQALALVDQAEVALAAVETREDAEVLWRKVGAVAAAARIARVSKGVAVAMRRVHFRAERRWGELLGPPEPPESSGRRGGQGVTAGNALPGSDRKAQHQARQVAAVPQEDFEEYLGQEDPDDLTRAGLLRAAAGEVTLPQYESEHGKLEVAREKMELDKGLHAVRATARDLLERVETYGVWSIHDDRFQILLDLAEGAERDIAQVRAALAERVREEGLRR